MVLRAPPKMIGSEEERKRRAEARSDWQLVCVDVAGCWLLMEGVTHGRGRASIPCFAVHPVLAIAVARHQF